MLSLIRHSVEIQYKPKHELLYHLTNKDGLDFCLSRNVLKSKNYDYISTTFSDKIEYINGRHDYEYRLVLDGFYLEQVYGWFEYHDYRDECEIGLATPIIKDLKDYIIKVETLPKHSF
jgi:hypothetical protein